MCLLWAGHLLANRPGVRQETTPLFLLPNYLSTTRSLWPAADRASKHPATPVRILMADLHTSARPLSPEPAESTAPARRRPIRLRDPVFMLGKWYVVAHHYGGVIELRPARGPGRSFWLSKSHFYELTWDSVWEAWRLAPD